jgi:hypothetical protein
MNSVNCQPYYQAASVMASNPYTMQAHQMQVQQQRGFFGDVYSYHSQPTTQYMYNPSAGGSAMSIVADLATTASASNAHLSPIPIVSSAFIPHSSSIESSTISTAASATAAEGDVSSVMPAASYSNSNPYASLLNKANLKIQGSMDEMAINWSTEEWDNRRRLVQFWRRQDGNDIYCTFAPISASERQPNSIVVSCIYWHEKGDCYITSVDTIMLLENLIGVRFTVEEKNRIRRNLEGFRPVTVSKCKSESAEFFKLIMSFPNPKPRNIEKDVKVFPWTVLPYALKKIISKYTASYSSTASVNVDAIQNPSYPASLPATASVHSASPASEAYGAEVSSSSNSPLQTSPHIVVSQGSRVGSVSPLQGQVQQQQQQQQQQEDVRGAYHAAQPYDTLSPYTSSRHHQQSQQYHHHQQQQTVLYPQASSHNVTSQQFVYRHISPYAAPTDQVTYDAYGTGVTDLDVKEEAVTFGSSASGHNENHASTPRTLGSWCGADDE